MPYCQSWNLHVLRRFAALVGLLPRRRQVLIPQSKSTALINSAVFGYETDPSLLLLAGVGGIVQVLAGVA